MVLGTSSYNEPQLSFFLQNTLICMVILTCVPATMEHALAMDLLASDRGRILTGAGGVL